MNCIICERRPATDDVVCHNCGQKIDKERRARQKPKPEYYLTYKGGVVGLFRNNGTLKGQALNINPERLPKTNTINLNRYCEGYSRAQIKAFKRAVLTLCLITE